METDEQKEEFDVSIMLQSIAKAQRINEKLKLKMPAELIQDMATTFFNSSIQKIRESRREKNKKEEDIY